MALRDSLGFLVAVRPSGLELPAETHALHEAPCNAATAQAWERAGPLPAISHARLKMLVRSGVPQQCRADLWYYASGGFAMCDAAPPDTYTRLAAAVDALPPGLVKQMHTDSMHVGSTWRSHPLLAKPEPLFRILTALINRSPVAVTYTRGLCQIAAFVLVVFGGTTREEDAFWTLAAALQDRLFSHCNGQWLLGVRVEQDVLGALAVRKLPRLTAHLASMQLVPATFTQPWQASLYVSCLPPEACARVWDCALVEGPKPMLRVGLALLKMYEQTLTSCTFPEVLRKILDLRVSRTTDSAALLNMSFKGIGSLPGEHITSLRNAALGEPPAAPPSVAARAGLALGLTRRSPDTATHASPAPCSPAGSSGSELLTPTLTDTVGPVGGQQRTMSGPVSCSTTTSGQSSPARSTRHAKKGSMGSLSGLIAKLGWGGSVTSGPAPAVGAEGGGAAGGARPPVPRASSLRRNATTPSLSAC